MYTILLIRREIYYSDPIITQSENDVSTAINDICCLLDAQPWEMGILSQSKGLIAGPLKITMPNGQFIDIPNKPEGEIIIKK